MLNALRALSAVLQTALAFRCSLPPLTLCVLSCALVLITLAASIAPLTVAGFGVVHAQSGDQLPPAPSSTTVVNGANPGEVDLLWSAVAGANYYRVGWIADPDYRTAQDAGAPWIERFAFVDIDGKTEYTITRLTPGTDYWFIVASNKGRYGQPQWPANWVRLTLNDDPSACAAATTTEPTPTPTSASKGDYDVDNDGLVEISNLAQLDAMRHDLDGDGSSTHPDHAAAFPNTLAGMGCPTAGCIGYELTSNLDFDTNASGQVNDGDAYWNGGWGWTPIGDPDEAYRWNAAFDGGGHTISNLYIDWDDTNYVGLFRAAGPNSMIKNVGLDAVTVTGNSRVGGLVGNNRGTIVNSYASGEVTGEGGAVGGLVGSGNGSITDSYANVTVTGKGNNVGGLAGHISGAGYIMDSHATGDVTSDGNNVGGLVGSSGNGAAITASYATGNTSGKNDTGGLVGRSDDSGITASYATGSVSGIYSTRVNRGDWYVTNDGERVGGLIGSGINIVITASYATGAVRGAEMVGGLVGHASESEIGGSYAAGNTAFPHTTHWRGPNGSGGGLIGGSQDTTITDSYWDIQSTGLSHSSGGIGKTTRELQSPTADTGVYANWSPNWWDFGTVRQYPALKYRGLDVETQRR